MLTLHVRGIRSFADAQRISIAPLTVLTGENSSGKSTLLAILAAVLDPQGFPFRPIFNRPPYNLGTYDTIASYKGGRFGRAANFGIGFHDDSPRPGVAREVTADYVESDGQPAVSIVHVKSARGEVTLRFNLHTADPSLHVVLTTEQKEEERTFKVDPSFRDIPYSFDLMSLFYSVLTPGGDADKNSLQFIEKAGRIARTLAPARSLSLAPIRTRPERVYSQPTEAFDPGGNHIPFILDKYLREGGAKEKDAIQRALVQFGRESGLYEEVGIRRLGRSAGDPFQVTVRIGGRMRNVIDVGYGVSQVIPLIVQIVMLPPRHYLLVQQPEIHLHPRAQAALGSLLAGFLSTGRRLVIETHSDYLIDRLRQEIGAGKLQHESVRILYLERRGLESYCHTLHLDASGNIVNAPDSYREFFLEEQLRLFSRGDQ